MCACIYAHLKQQGEFFWCELRAGQAGIVEALRGAGDAMPVMMQPCVLSIAFLQQGVQILVRLSL